MSTDRGTDKEGVAHICDGIFITQPLKSEIMPFAATWMGMDSVTVSEVRQRRRNIV